MANKKDVMRDLEKLYPDLEHMILRLINLGGQKYAAEQLYTTQQTISNYLRSHGYIKQEKWIKNPELETTP